MKKSNVLTLFLTAFLMCMLLIFPQNAAESCKEALVICFKIIVPSLFPFMVLSSLLISCGGADILGRIFSVPFRILFRLSGACSASLIVGLIAGFPVGASVTADMVKRGDISKDEGERLLGFCSNAGPMFIMGSAAAMLGISVKGGFVLWLSQVASAVLVGMILGIGKAPEKNSHVHSVYNESAAYCTVSAVKKSVMSVLYVCGFVTVFAAITSMIGMSGVSELIRKCTGLNPLETDFILNGFTEITAGISHAALLPYKPTLLLPLCSGFIGWSGLCVHMQVAASIEGSGLSLKYYFIGKLMQMIFAPVFTLLFMRFMGGSIKTSAFLNMPNSSLFGLFAVSFFICLCFCILLLAIFSVFSQSRKSAKKL